MAVDVEEIAPGRFIVRDTRAAPILRGEGTLSGRFFELGTWRREGLVARLRAADLSVRTLDDQVAALPKLPPPPPGGPPGWRPLATAGERFSRFDADLLGWAPIEPEARAGQAGVAAAPGDSLRRRKGRGPAQYYLAAAERGGGLGLRVVDELSAVLSGYARAAAGGPIERAAEPDGEGALLPELLLPAPHRAVVERIAEQRGGRWRAEGRGLELAAALLARLGVALALPAR